MGRRCNRDASSVASQRDLPRSWSCLPNSTIKVAFGSQPHSPASLVHDLTPVLEGLCNRSFLFSVPRDAQIRGAMALRPVSNRARYPGHCRRQRATAMKWDRSKLPCI